MPFVVALAASLLVLAAQHVLLRARGRGRAGAFLFRALVVSGAVQAGFMFGPFAALLFGLAVNGVYARDLVAVMRRERELATLYAQLSTKDAPSALASIGQRLAAIRPPQIEYAVWADYVLEATERASDAGHMAAAGAWLAMLDAAWLAPEQRAPVARRLAAIKLGESDWKGARRALAIAPRPAPADDEEVLVAQETLVDVLEGEHREAVERATRRLASPNREARRTWRMVRAHALAAGGRPGEATAALAELRAEEGDAPIRQIAGQGGPASACAAALLADVVPYR